MTREVVNNIYGNELNKKRYGEYKNYFIELILGRAKENFQEKRSGYERLIRNIVEEQDRKKRQLLMERN
jgi:hypothetical protein